MASMVRFKYPSNGNRPPVDLCWYDGGMRPSPPEEITRNNKELPAEGMMFVGEKGKILAGFNVQSPQLFSGDRIETTPPEPEENQDEWAAAHLRLFANACKTGKQYPGSFPEAQYLTEAINLYAVALRSNKILDYDAQAMKITNVPEANKYLSREYRRGWDPGSI
jgi:hypothetical protein